MGKQVIIEQEGQQKIIIILTGEDRELIHALLAILMAPNVNTPTRGIDDGIYGNLGRSS